jgi:hypothetical protein
MDVRRVRSRSIPWCQLLFVLVRSTQLSTFALIHGHNSWYKRSEFGIRAALFFSAATVSGAFGGLLAVSLS